MNEKKNRILLLQIWKVSIKKTKKIGIRDSVIKRRDSRPEDRKIIRLYEKS